jgi:hypothetical protein
MGTLSAVVEGNPERFLQTGRYSLREIITEVMESA